MSGGGSVTQWIQLLRQGDHGAAQPLWERYFAQLEAVARQKLRGLRPAVADAEDVALSAFDSLCRGLERGRFPRLNDRDNLWRLLVVITARKVAHLLRDEHCRKRGGGQICSCIIGLDSPEVDQVINRFYHETVGPYWTPDRRLVEDGYRSLEFPFEEFTPPAFAMSAEWTFEHQVGYLGTWSAVGRYRNEEGSDPVALVVQELERAWGDRTRRVQWPLSVRAGRV